MQYKVKMEFLVKTRVDEDRLHKQVECLWEFGTIREAIAEALHLNEDPNSLSLSVGPHKEARLTLK